jgi:hypothetical protein
VSVVVPQSHRVRPSSNLIAVVDQTNREIVIDEDGPLIFHRLSDAHHALSWAQQEWQGRPLALQIVFPLLYPATVLPE